MYTLLICFSFFLNAVSLAFWMLSVITCTAAAEAAAAVSPVLPGCSGASGTVVMAHPFSIWLMKADLKIVLKFVFPPR